MVITNTIEKWQEKALLAWLVSWLFCGFVFGYYLFAEGDREFKLGMGIMLVFWLVFMLKSARVYSWRTRGYEKIVIENGALELGRYYGKRGIPKRFEFSQVSEIGRTALEDKSFAGVFQGSFWVVGGEKLYIRAQGKDHIFGCQLDEKEQQKVVTILKRNVRM